MPQAGEACGQIARENSHSGGSLGRTLWGKIPLGYAKLPQEVL